MYLTAMSVPCRRSCVSLSAISLRSFLQSINSFGGPKTSARYYMGTSIFVLAPQIRRKSLIGVAVPAMTGTHIYEVLMA